MLADPAELLMFGGPPPAQQLSRFITRLTRFYGRYSMTHTHTYIYIYIYIYIIHIDMINGA